MRSLPRSADFMMKIMRTFQHSFTRQLLRLLVSVSVGETAACDDRSFAGFSELLSEYE